MSGKIVNIPIELDREDDGEEETPNKKGANQEKKEISKPSKGRKQNKKGGNQGTKRRGRNTNQKDTSGDEAEESQSQTDDSQEVQTPKRKIEDAVEESPNQENETSDGKMALEIENKLQKATIEDQVLSGSGDNEEHPFKKSLSIKLTRSTLEFETKIAEQEYLKKFDFMGKPKINLPNKNVPEKIVLVIDRAQDDISTPFRAGDQNTSPLDMLKRVAKSFIIQKSLFHPKHEFAIVTLNENNVEWIVDFTRDQKTLFNHLNGMASCEVEDTFVMNSLFETILEKTEVPIGIVSSFEPPPFVTRAILFYGRSFTIPKLERDRQIEELLENPYFIFDTLMTHEEVDKSNNSNKIIESLQQFNKTGIGYMLPVGRNTNRINMSIGKMLGHPLQRSQQKIVKT